MTGGDPNASPFLPLIFCNPIPFAYWTIKYHLQTILIWIYLDQISYWHRIYDSIFSSVFMFRHDKNLLIVQIVSYIWSEILFLRLGLQTLFLKQSFWKQDEDFSITLIYNSDYSGLKIKYTFNLMKFLIKFVPKMYYGSVCRYSINTLNI